jgi:hypothetical protein
MTPKYIYDLAQAPASFDFMTFLAVCATTAQGPFDLSILKGPKNGFRDDMLEPRDVDSRMALLHNVVIPACQLYPVRNLNLFPEKAEGERLPYHYSALYQDQPMPSLKVPEWARKAIRSMYPQPPVVITLRESAYHTARNSNVEEWLIAGDVIAAKGHNVVYVREFGKGPYDAPFDQRTWQKDDIFPASNLILRAALHEWALIVMGVNNGTMGLSHYNSNATYAIFKMLADTPATSLQWFTGLGWAPGCDIPFHYPNQRLIWEEDTFETIMKVFDETPKEKSGKDYFEPAKPIKKLYHTMTADYSDMLRNIEANLNRNTDMLLGVSPHDGKALIVGGGPSLQENLPGLRLHAKRGHIFAVNGAHDFLIERGIVPEFMVMLDAREENSRFVQKPHRKVTYLISSQCHPKVFEALEGYHVIQWVPEMPGIEGVGEQFPDKPLICIGGGSTVSLKTMCLVHVWGYRQIHLFGMDSSYREAKHHAYEQDLNDKDDTITIVAAGKRFKCANWMAKQASDFQNQLKPLMDEGSQIHVHGDGLIPWIFHHWSGNVRARHG